MKKGRQSGLPKVTKQVSSNQQGYTELMQQTLGARGAEGSGVGVGHSVPRMLSPHSPTVHWLQGLSCLPDIPAPHTPMAPSLSPPSLLPCQVSVLPILHISSLPLHFCPSLSISPFNYYNSFLASWSPGSSVYYPASIFLPALIMSHSCSKTSHGSSQLQNKVQPSHSIQGLAHPPRD